MKYWIDTPNLFSLPERTSRFGPGNRETQQYARLGVLLYSCPDITYGSENQIPASPG